MFASTLPRPSPVSWARYRHTRIFWTPRLWVGREGVRAGWQEWRKTLAGLKRRAAKLIGSLGSLRSDREVDGDALPLGEAVEHAFEGELAADAALLVAAVRHAGRLAAALVDLHPAGFDGMSGAQRLADVVRPDISGEAVMAVVGHADRLGL